MLESVLSKLSRYDEGTFFSSILSFTVSTSALFQLIIKVHLELMITSYSICFLLSNFFKVKAAAKYVDVPVSMIFPPRKKV